MGTVPKKVPTIVLSTCNMLWVPRPVCMPCVSLVGHALAVHLAVGATTPTACRVVCGRKGKLSQPEQAAPADACTVQLPSGEPSGRTFVLSTKKSKQTFKFDSVLKKINNLNLLYWLNLDKFNQRFFF